MDIVLRLQMLPFAEFSDGVASCESGMSCISNVSCDSSASCISEASQAHTQMFVFA